LRWGRTATDPRQVAQGFVNHLNGVLNRTVTQSRLVTVQDTTVAHPRFDVLRLVAHASQPLELNRSSLLLVAQQKIDIVEARCQTVTYHYRLQRDAGPNSWLVRWEFLREKPTADYDYPLAHIHVNGEVLERERRQGILRSATTPVAGRPDGSSLHFPTRRVPLELVLQHLIVEWGVEPLDDDWRAILGESIGGFEERQTIR
jgi:hypothetical protein